MDTIFSVQAVMSLVDNITAPLRAVRGGMADTERQAAGLASSMGRITRAMAPFAVAAGVFLAGLAPAVGTAADFQAAVSGVGAVSNAGAGQMRDLKQAALDLGASTAWSALNVTAAEKKLAMAGYSVRDNIAALPGVLNLASAAQEDLGGTADIASNILSAFKLKASQTGEVADILTATFTSSNTPLSGLGATMATVGPVAQAAGASLADVAAMAAKLGDVGVPAAVAGTGIKIAFQRLQAPAGAAAKQLQELGIATKDSTGNMLPIFDILKNLEVQTAAMGSADRAAVFKKIFGEEAIGSVTALMNQGIDTIREYAATLENATGKAASVAAMQLDNLKGATTLLSSGWEGLKITIGSIFLPVLTLLVHGITRVVGWLNVLAKSSVGKVLIGMAAAVSVAVIAFTAFTGVVALAGIPIPFVATALAGLGAAIAAVSWPVWALAAAVGVLYVAWRKNFGGIADIVSGWWRKISLVFQGVRAVFETLSGTSGMIEGALAKKIKAAGLIGLVTTVAQVVYRIKSFFSGLWDAVKFGAAGVVEILRPIFNSIAGVVSPLWDIFKAVGSAIADVIGILTGGAAATDVSGWRTFGEVVGIVITGAWQMLAGAVRIALVPLQLVFDVVGVLLRGFILLGEGIGTACGWIVEKFTQLWSAAGKIAGGIGDIFDAMGAAVKWAFMNLTPVGWLIQAFTGVYKFLDGIDFSKSGVKMMHTLAAGIKSALMAPVDLVKSGLSKIRNLLPFSDAKEGPLSALTASGRAMMNTLGVGVRGAAPGLSKTVKGAVAGVAAAMVIAAPGMADIPTPAMEGEIQPPTVADVQAPAMPKITAPSMEEIQPPTVADISPPAMPDIPKSGELPGPDMGAPSNAAGERPSDASGKTAAQSGEKQTIIQNLTINLSGVQNADSFIEQLNRLVEGYDV